MPVGTMTKNGVTMKDVAKKACVTTQTVSRALGGDRPGRRNLGGPFFLRDIHYSKRKCVPYFAH